MTRQQLEWRRRAAVLGWATAILAILAGAFALAAVRMALTDEHGTLTQQGGLPLPLRLTHAVLTLLPAIVLGVAAVLMFMASTQTATAMRVLSPDRPLPAPLSDAQVRLRRRVLGPLGDRIPALETPVDWPQTMAPHPTPDRPLRLTVLIPAHNEEAIVGSTIASLRAQTTPPARVIVIADNCTDRTAEVVDDIGVEVRSTVGNTRKKAGALNQALADLLPSTDDSDVVMVMDADSTLSSNFIEVALGLLQSDPDLMAVGGVFDGEPGEGLIGQLQRNEFVRYQRLVLRRPGRVFVLTGTAALIRAGALEAVAAARGTLLPGHRGEVYDTLALTEDNELTLALKTLGARLDSPPECRVTTEIMPSARALWRQRLRWHRGALENIGAYGLTRATGLYWAQQIGLAYGVVALGSYLLMAGISLLAADSFVLVPFWTAIGVIFITERVVTAWNAGWPGRLVAAPIVLELGYAVFLQACFVTSIVQISLHRRAEWNYVERQVAP
ncbi:hypothetical protein ASC77_09175 [Nocardioides sp. Root1257]|uniref:glycosyltransferase family 2 protein n=1 Tax=unclassified Nocardioides TaxID=2615069 RepID=UPI0006FB21F0|nr:MULTISPECIES: glycosyltransferase family 2 protein [unclassified Nocardioides]KQW48883.1 hypothetical protein ASC77_09175 [Nocardioides sp. Root1257]KRC48058.1 hypothetical protein ASE24_09180 [Nocardioides sp. Root224]